jgi:hypothetical protein
MRTITRQPLSPADLAVTQRANTGRRPNTSERTSLLPAIEDISGDHLAAGLFAGPSAPVLAYAAMKLSPLSQSFNEHSAAYAAHVLTGIFPVTLVTGGLLAIRLTDSLSERQSARGYAALAGGTQAHTTGIAKVALLSAALGFCMTAITGTGYWLNYSGDQATIAFPPFMAFLSLLPISAGYACVSRCRTRLAEQSAHERLNQPPAIALDDLAAQERFYAV